MQNISSPSGGACIGALVADVMHVCIECGVLYDICVERWIEWYDILWCVCVIASVTSRILCHK